MANNVKVVATKRKDGAYTVTITLTGWTLNYLRGLVKNLSISHFGRDIAITADTAIEEAAK